MRAAVLLLALLLLLPPPPPFAARWERPGVARIAWQQPAGIAATCLYRNTTLMRCWRDLAPGPTYTTLGDVGPLDHSARPQVHDVFWLTLDALAWRAQLRGVVRLALVRGR